MPENSYYRNVARESEGPHSQDRLSRGIKGDRNVILVTWSYDFHHGHIYRMAVFTIELRGARAVYSVFVQLGDGEFLHVVSRDDLEQAVQLVEALKASWPREYVVRVSEGWLAGLRRFRSPGLPRNCRRRRSLP
jgi:hypothetical protein